MQFNYCNLHLRVPERWCNNATRRIAYKSGNYYTGKPTLGGTVAQASLGVLGLDAPADFRDLTYDLNHRDSIPKSQLALDALALLPLVGGLKYVDDAAGGMKAAAKQADNLMDTGGHARYNGVKLFGLGG